MYGSHVTTERPAPSTVRPSAPESTPAPSRRELALATTLRRGETLFADGYTIEPYADRPGIYAVTRPAERPLRAGEALWYDVDVCNQTCQCGAFEFHGTCKHIVATNKAVAEAARILGPMLPVEAGAPVAPAVAAAADAPRVNAETRRRDFD